MPRRGITRNTLAGARLLVRAVSQRLGFPQVAPPSGVGIQPSEAERTCRVWKRAKKHPSLAQWALELDDTIEAVLTPAERAALVDLLAAWDDAKDDEGSE